MSNKKLRIKKVEENVNGFKVYFTNFFDAMRIWGGNSKLEDWFKIISLKED
ncbi:MAG: hypothetical protein WC516_04505 [Patescibacteria group bacterium]|jgi:hypothetical protein